MRKVVLIVLILAGLIFLVSGCRKSKDQEDELIRSQMDLLEKQVDALEAHQESLKQSLNLIQHELDKMDKELDGIRRRNFTARSSVEFMGDLMEMKRESDFSWVLRNFSISTQVLLWILVLWLFYRLREGRSGVSSAPVHARVPERYHSPVGAGVTPAREEKPAARPEPETTPAGSKEKAKIKPVGCKVKGCNSKHRSKGFCNRHYQQWRRGTLTEPIEE